PMTRRGTLKIAPLWSGRSLLLANYFGVALRAVAAQELIYLAGEFSGTRRLLLDFDGVVAERRVQVACDLLDLELVLDFGQLRLARRATAILELEAAVGLRYAQRFDLRYELSDLNVHLLSLCLHSGQLLAGSVERTLLGFQKLLLGLELVRAALAGVEI